MLSKKKFFLPVFAFSFVLLFLIMSCNEANISESSTDERTGTVLMKDSIVAFHTGDKKPPCGSKDVVVWNIDHYFPINGRKKNMV